MNCSNRKVIFVLLAGALVFSVMTSNAAATGSWFIAGTKLAKGVTVALANTAAVDETIALSEPSLGVTLGCSGSSIRGTKAYIQGESSGGAASLTFTACDEFTPTTCSVQPEIETEPVLASVETGAAPLTRIRFAPKTGKVFATVDFSGTCAMSGEQALDGQVVLDSKTGQDESASQPAEALGTTENNSLELLEKKVFLLCGKELLKLASGQRWSYH
jgi:hypothetical protein